MPAKRACDEPVDQFETENVNRRFMPSLAARSRKRAPGQRVACAKNSVKTAATIFNPHLV